MIQWPDLWGWLLIFLGALVGFSLAKKKGKVKE